MNIFIGMETSGMLRQRFQARGHFVLSVDTLPSEDGAGRGGWEELGGHIIGDVFDTFWRLRNFQKIKFDLGIFHPDCTYMTNSAAWAFNDPNFYKYPGVGYHQKVKPGTLVGAARREAREKALQGVREIINLPIPKKAIENPIGAITKVRPFTQIVQPYQFGDDASKATGLILENLPPLPEDLAKYHTPRMICRQCGGTTGYTQAVKGCLHCGAESGTLLPRWSNQTDSGQNNLSPGEHRWKNRSRTYPGIADAMVATWGNSEHRDGARFDHRVVVPNGAAAGALNVAAPGVPVQSES